VYIFGSIFAIIQFSKQSNKGLYFKRLFYSYKIHIEKRERKQDIREEKNSWNGKENITQRRKENVI